MIMTRQCDRQESTGRFWNFYESLISNGHLFFNTSAFGASLFALNTFGDSRAPLRGCLFPLFIASLHQQIDLLQRAVQFAIS